MNADDRLGGQEAEQESRDHGVPTTRWAAPEGLTGAREFEILFISCEPCVPTSISS